MSFCVYMTRLNTRKFAVFLLLFFMCDDVLFYVQHENMSGASKKGIQDAPRALDPVDGASHATEARRMEVCRIH